MDGIDYRDLVMEMVEDGFDSEHLLLCCLKYMSQIDIKDMLIANDFDTTNR